MNNIWYPYNTNLLTSTKNMTPFSAIVTLLSTNSVLLNRGK